MKKIFRTYTRYLFSQENANFICVSSLAAQKHQNLVPIDKILKTEQGVDFWIKFIRNLNIKPSFQDNMKDPFEKPYNKEFYLGKIDVDYNLFLNKFPIMQNHLIVCTEEFKKQESQNTDEDLYQTYRVVQALNGFGFFNSCPEAGSSVQHKHLQVLPEQAFNESSILKMISQAINTQQTSVDKIEDLRYKFTLFKGINHSIRPIQHAEKQHIYNVYLELLKDISKKDHMTNDSITNLKYNLIITTKFLMIVERKLEKFRNEITLNGVAFTGSLLVKNQQQLALLNEFKIIQVLEEVCQPSNLQTESDCKILWI